MTELLPEKQQRRIYEWFYPELKGEKWWIALRQGDPVAVWDYNPDRDAYAGKVPLQDLYMPDGKPNYQSFITEVVPRLHDDGWHIVVVDSCVHNATIISRYDNPHIGFTDPDPWFALSELLEAT